MQHPFNENQIKLYQDFLKETGRLDEQGQRISGSFREEFETWLEKKKPSILVEYQKQFQVDYRPPKKRRLLPLPPFQFSLKNCIRRWAHSITISAFLLLALLLIIFLCIPVSSIPSNESKISHLSFVTLPSENVEEELPDEPPLEENVAETLEETPIEIVESLNEPFEDVNVEIHIPEEPQQQVNLEIKQEVPRVDVKASNVIPNNTDSLVPTQSIVQTLSQNKDKNLSHRLNKRTRQKLLQHHGGRIEVLQAVDDALQWLATHQNKQGFWSPGSLQNTCRAHQHSPCDLNTLYPNRYDEAVSALCLLAFLGSGHTEAQGEYTETVKRGFNWLIKQQNTDGSFGPPLGSHGYSTGIVTLTLIEYEQMQPSNQVRSRIHRAITWLSNNQVKKGGWDYNPGTKRADVSISSWCTLSLLRGVERGFYHGHTAALNGVDFIRHQMRNDGRVIYESHPFSSSTLGSVAAGLLIEQYKFKRTRSKWRRVLSQYILSFTPDKYSSSNTYYYWYTATLAMFHQGGSHWKKWWPQVEKHLLSKQIKSGGQKGSFPPLNHGYGASIAKTGGRLVTTAFAALTLECPWRYLPLNRKKSNAYLASSQANLSPEEIILSDSVNDKERIKALGQLYKSDVNQKIIDQAKIFLKSKNIPLKMEAARFLSHRSDPQAISVIMDYFQTHPQDIRAHAAAHWLVTSFANHPQTAPAIWNLAQKQDNPFVTKRLINMLRKTSDLVVADELMDWSQQTDNQQLKKTAQDVATALFDQDS